MAKSWVEERCVPRIRFDDRQRQLSYDIFRIRAASLWMRLQITWCKFKEFLYS
jgi:hypothetical protein